MAKCFVCDREAGAHRGLCDVCSGNAGYDTEGYSFEIESGRAHRDLEREEKPVIFTKIAKKYKAV